MSTFGIVCEFNPFHKGHKYLFDEARRMGAERIVCVMSGNSVQRGELAITDKYVRAEAAIREGADLVLELPYPWCAGSAEYFARGAAAVLSQTCDTILFGSECGDIEALRRAAEVSESDDFRKCFGERLTEGVPSAEAYFSELGERMGMTFSSNDILGVEYLRALSSIGSYIDARTLKRKGNAYREEELDAQRYPSATALRKLWKSSSVEESGEYIPPNALEVFSRAEKQGEIANTSLIDSAVLYFFRVHTGDELSVFAECGGGVANRLCNAAKEASSYSELIDIASTKRYTYAKLRRAILFAMTGVTDKMLKGMPEYTMLLGASERGRELLGSMRKKEGNLVGVITKGADAPKESLQFAVSERLDSLFTLTLGEKEKRASFSVMKKRAFVRK